MRKRGAIGWWAVCLLSLLAYDAAASSRLLQGRGKGHRHNIQCCPQGCGSSCNGGGGGSGGSTTSAYAFISSQPELSTAKSVVDETGLRPVLEGPFANTLFVPNNAALDAYAARITANVTWNTDIGRGFLKLFFTKVLQYHIVTGSYSMSSLVAGDVGTLYVSNNGMPHKVTTSRGNVLVDEQGNAIGISGPSQAVTGGGYVHVISGVLEANDIFPSLAEALALDQFSQLRAVIQKIENTDPNPPLTVLLEGISGTFALPNNQAFEGLNIADIDAKTLLDVVTYHLCPFKRMYRLLFTPFVVGKKPGKNPCLPVFSRAYDFPYGLKWAFNSPTNITVTFATGSFPDALVAEDASIVFADISIPTQSAHVISSLIMPPANISVAAASAASRKQHTTRLINVLQSLSTSSSKGKQQGNSGSSIAGSGWNDDDDVSDDDVDSAPGANDTPVSIGGGSGRGNSGNGNAGVRGARGKATLDSLIARADDSSSSSSATNHPANKDKEQEDGSQQQQQQQKQQQQQQQQQSPQPSPASKPTARRQRNRQNNVANPNDLAALQAGGSSSSSTSGRRRRQRSENKPAVATSGSRGSAAAPSDNAGSVRPAVVAGGGLAGALEGLSIASRP